MYSLLMNNGLYIYKWPWRSVTGASGNCYWQLLITHLIDHLECTLCSFGWWLVLICSEINVLVSGCWWLVCSERKVLLADG
jgi:hypothetical protein